MQTRTLGLYLLAASALSFVLAVAGADAGASEITLTRALCAVAVLGAASITALLHSRDLY